METGELGSPMKGQSINDVGASHAETLVLGWASGDPRMMPEQPLVSSSLANCRSTRRQGHDPLSQRLPSQFIFLCRQVKIGPDEPRVDLVSSDQRSRHCRLCKVETGFRYPEVAEV
jgi:hypothetical protein